MKRLAITLLSVVLVLTIARLGAVRASDPGQGSGAAGSVEYVGTLLVQLRVADLERSVTFYRDVLGLRLKHRNDALKWVKFDAGIKGVTIGLGEGPEVKGSGSVSINLGVADVDAARRTLESRGVTFLGDTITVPDVVKLADLTDPDGNRIRLAQALTTGD